MPIIADISGRYWQRMTPDEIGRAVWVYVYELVDPRTGKPFYVGKGIGKRIFAHEREAELGLLTRKCQQIRDIWAAGLEVERRITALFRDRKLAQFHELDRIWELGYENLTNGCTGHPARISERKRG